MYFAIGFGFAVSFYMSSDKIKSEPTWEKIKIFFCIIIVWPVLAGLCAGSVFDQINHWEREE